MFAKESNPEIVILLETAVVLYIMGQNTRNWHTATGFLLQEPCDQKAIFSIYAAETGNENSRGFGRMDFEKKTCFPAAHPFKDICRLELFLPPFDLAGQSL
jgi:hypothetical protein